MHRGRLAKHASAIRNQVDPADKISENDGKSKWK